MPHSSIRQASRCHPHALIIMVARILSHFFPAQSFVYSMLDPAVYSPLEKPLYGQRVPVVVWGTSYGLHRLPHVQTVDHESSMGGVMNYCGSRRLNALKAQVYACNEISMLR